MGRSSSPERRERRSRRSSRSRSRSPRRDRSKRKNRFDEGPPGGSKWDMAPNPDDPDQKAATERLTLSLNLGKIAMGQQTSKYIMVPNASSSSLIGRGGSVINKLKADSGAKIQFQQKDDMAPGAQERGVTISGSAVQVAEAEKLIMVIVAGGGAPIGGPGAPSSAAPSAGPPMGGGGGIGTGGLIRLGFGGGGGGGGGAAFAAGGPPAPRVGMPPVQMGGGGSGQKVISVPMSAVGSIIGRGGSVIKRLMEESGTQIRLQQKEDLKPGQTDREVTITGAPHQVEQASGMIMEIVVEASGGGGGGAPPRIGMGGPSRGMGINNKKTMTVSNTDVGCLIGRGGSIIKGLIADSGCHIEIQQKDQMQSDYSGGGLMREVYLYGTDEQIATAERMVLNLLPQQYQGSLDGAYGFPPGGSYGNNVGPAVQWQPPPSTYNNAPPPNGGGYPQQQVGPTEANYNPYGIKPQTPPPHSTQPSLYDPYGTNSSSGGPPPTNYSSGGGNSYSTGNNDYGGGGMSGGGMSDYGYGSSTGASRDGGYAPPPVSDGRGNSQPYGSHSSSQGDPSWGSSYGGPPPVTGPPSDGRGPSEPYRNNSWAPPPTTNNSYAPPPTNSHQPPPQQQPPWGGNY